jgi:hypothetical protein
MLATFGFCSVICGVALSVTRDHHIIKPFVARRLAGPLFILGFVLLGVVMGHWHFE